MLQKISKQQLLTYQRSQPKLNDLELVSLSHTIEDMGIDSENNPYKQFPCTISSKIERSVYNLKRRKLAVHIDVIRLKLVAHFNEFVNYFILESVPLEVYKLSRGFYSATCEDNSYNLPDKGYFASQNSNYYEYKLHPVCSVSGVFQSVDLSTTYVNDANFFQGFNTRILSKIVSNSITFLLKQGKILHVYFTSKTCDSLYILFNLRNFFLKTSL